MCFSLQIKGLGCYVFFYLFYYFLQLGKRILVRQNTMNIHIGLRISTIYLPFYYDLYQLMKVIWMLYC